MAAVLGAGIIALCRVEVVADRGPETLYVCVRKFATYL